MLYEKGACVPWQDNSPLLPAKDGIIIIDLASWDKFDKEEDNTKIQISAEPGTKLGTMWLKAEILLTVPTKEEGEGGGEEEGGDVGKLLQL